MATQCTCCKDIKGTSIKIKANLRTVQPSQTKQAPNIPLSLQKTKTAVQAAAKGVYTITFGDVAENGIGMEQLGQKYGRGLSVTDLKQAQTNFNKLGLTTDYVDLTLSLTDADLEHLRGEGKPKAIKKKSQLPETMSQVEAGILIVRNGVRAFGIDPDKLKEEQQQIQYDSQKLNQYKKKVRALARHNVCFDDFDQDINLDIGKGTVIDFKHLPLLSKIRNELKEFVPVLNELGAPLKAEGNYYYNRAQCGIGWHGDKERRVVIAVRLGESMDINYNWWYGNQPVGKRTSAILNHGDIYFMSDKAVGHDTGAPSKLTLRHCAGHFDKRDF